MTTKQAHIITLTTNPAIDTSTSVDLLVPENKLKCKNPIYKPGGGGINVARVIKRLGHESVAIFQSSGNAGVLLEQLLKSESILCKPYSTQAWTRENFIVSDESTQHQYRFGMPGPTYLKEEIKACAELILNLDPIPSYLVLSGSLAPGIPDDFFVAICEWAKVKGIRVILDCSGAPLKKTVHAGVFLVKPNLSELCQLAGREKLSKIEQEETALSLIERQKAEVVVVSLGAKGAMMATKEGIEYLKAPSVKVKSTVGAGDSMVAGMVWALYNEFDNSTMLKYGLASGSAATMNYGTELSQKKDVERLFKTFSRNPKS